MILIHAIIHRTWDVAKFYSDSLSLWVPAASNSEQLLPQSEAPPKYLATIPQFSSWRNSACDCLDLLHWDALAVSAKAGGLEGPVFLTLHLARMVLLSPVKELEGLADTIINQPHPCLLPYERLPLRQNFEECQETVQMWAKRDRYKARLAVLHSASTFWHVRCNSSSSFVQPFAIFLATIILWAYGTYSQGRPQNQAPTAAPDFHPQPNAPDAGSKDDTDAIEQCVDDEELSSSPSHASSRATTPYIPSIPNFMHIDRPFDDEIAQHFIRSGELMKIFLEGVGELCSATGPKFVLREGARILRRTSVWSVSEHYATRLEDLASRI